MSMGNNSEVLFRNVLMTDAQPIFGGSITVQLSLQYVWGIREFIIECTKKRFGFTTHKTIKVFDNFYDAMDFFYLCKEY